VKENLAKKCAGSSQNRHLESTGFVGKGVTFFAAKLGDVKRVQVFIKLTATVKDMLLEPRIQRTRCWR
jgi:hypothetical protein